MEEDEADKFERPKEIDDMDFKEASEAFSAIKDLEENLIKYIDKREAKGLNSIIDLIQADYSSITIRSSLQACVLAAMCWGKEGFLRLAKLMSSGNIDTYTIVAITAEVLAYTANVPLKSGGWI